MADHLREADPCVATCRGRCSLVTGAARGIGRSIADAFAANGSRVVYTDIDEAGALEAASARAGCPRSRRST